MDPRSEGLGFFRVCGDRGGKQAVGQWGGALRGRWLARRMTLRRKAIRRKLGTGRHLACQARAYPRGSVGEADLSSAGPAGKADLKLGSFGCRFS